MPNSYSRQGFFQPDKSLPRAVVRCCFQEPRTDANRHSLTFLWVFMLLPKSSEQSHQE